MLASPIRQVNAREVFEIGTYDGHSTRGMALNLAPNGHVTTLNLPPGDDTMSGGSISVDSQLNTKVTSG